MNIRSRGKDFVVDTACPPDTNRWETAVKIGKREWRILTTYDTYHEAMIGHGMHLLNHACRCCGRYVREDAITLEDAITIVGNISNVESCTQRPGAAGGNICTLCIPRHWGRHARGINASRCHEFKEDAITLAVSEFAFIFEFEQTGREV
jgi:hypothetical protein